MVEINLLSWREQKLAYERKAFRLMLITAICAATLLLAVIHLILSMDVRRLARQLQPVQMQQDEQLAEEREKDEIDLSASSRTDDIAANLLDVLADSARMGVCYQRVARQENEWEFSGKALSIWSLGAAQRVLVSSKLFPHLIMREILPDSQHGNYEFMLRVPLRDHAGE